MLSRYEEILVDERDQLDRFPATASIAYKENFLTRPIVNEYIDLLWKWIDSFNLGFARKNLWNGRELAVCLTHDVDEVQKYRLGTEIRKFGSLVLKHREPRKAFRRVGDYARCSLRMKIDPYWCFDYIVETELKYGLNSSFYMMTGGNTERSNPYSIDEPRVVELMEKLIRTGHEVGFHGSLNSCKDNEMFMSEKAKLDRIISDKQYGGRQHALRWETPTTWRIWEEAEMLYDATLSYADHEGFRCGICLPYRPFDVLENRVLNVWELPLTVMECTLQAERFRNLSTEKAWESISSLIDTVSKHNGVFVLLWHNGYLDELQFPGWRSLYERVMHYIGSKSVFGGNGREIVEWFERTI